MYTIKELYKIGNGPSSSHTIGPMMACKEFLKRYPNVDFVKVILYGSLALTGRGHLTDYIIEKTFHPIACHIEFDIVTQMQHPNTLRICGYQKREFIGELIVYSIGGGAIQIEGEKPKKEKHIYPLNTLKEIKEYCSNHHISLAQYVKQIEGTDFNDYMNQIYDAMLESVDRGIHTTGVLPGKLKINRKAAEIYHQQSAEQIEEDDLRRKTMAYAYAVCEENAAGGRIVTAPTCGACGVVPACLCYAIKKKQFSHEELIDALIVAGLIGNIVKTNGSISGAEAGCQAEVGTACAMGAAFLSYIALQNADMVERASEIALEHHLGLTCDPVDGYVQIPCIERNAVAALRAIDAAKLAYYLAGQNARVSFDMVVETMLDTGRDLEVGYRETAQGGLAKKIH